MKTFTSGMDVRFTINREYMMIMDAVVPKRPILHKKPINAFDVETEDDIYYLNVYLEFVLYRIKSDIESYRNALINVPCHDVKHVLSFMATKKTDMHDALISYRAYETADWFTSAFDTTLQKTKIDFVMDTGFDPLQNIIDAFYFAYRKEYESLKLFERVGRLTSPETPVRTMIESATEYQCRHILFLDALLAGFANSKEPDAIGYYPSAKDRTFQNSTAPTIHTSPSGRYSLYATSNLWGKQ